MHFPSGLNFDADKLVRVSVFCAFGSIIAGLLGRLRTNQTNRFPATGELAFPLSSPLLLI
jgi:hypothetical protein